MENKEVTVSSAFILASKVSSLQQFGRSWCGTEIESTVIVLISAYTIILPIRP